MSIPKKAILKPRMGHWWLLVDDHLNLWIPLARIANTECKNLAGMASLCRGYYDAGIVAELIGFGWIGDLDGIGNPVHLKSGEVLSA